MHTGILRRRQLSITEMIAATRNCDPESGHVFIFTNARRSRTKPYSPLKFLRIRRAGCNIDPRRRSKPEHRLRPVQYAEKPFQ